MAQPNSTKRQLELHHNESHAEAENHATKKRRLLRVEIPLRPKLTASSTISTAVAKQSQIPRSSERLRSAPRVSYRQPPVRFSTDDIWSIPSDSGSEDDFCVATDDTNEGVRTSGSDDSDTDIEESAPQDKRSSHSAKNSLKMSRNSSRVARGTKLQALRAPGQRGINYDLPPICEVGDMFLDMIQRAFNADIGWEKALKNRRGRKLRVATMCSGTESPLTALKCVAESLIALKMPTLDYEHLFSAEIVPFKQAFIQRNFAPQIIFRDIREFSLPEARNRGAHTCFGSLVAIPGNVDILIVGFSCVERSTFNNNKRGLAMGGETGDTLAAILDYARIWRPRMILLENVKGSLGDWQTISAMWKQIDYTSAWENVGTKNYYILHTRTRVYMLCVDQRQAANSSKLARRWSANLHLLQRPASSTLEHFLMRDDDLHVSHPDSLSTQTHSTWLKCEARHARVRATYKLGHKRPVTGWDHHRNVRNVIDHLDKKWHASQSNRVLDLIEISHLRNARPERGSFDSSYKQRAWILTQNVDHGSEDNQAFGLAQCITARQVCYLSNRGRLVSGSEALKLHGIPIDGMSFSIEDDRQLVDLAGNAMTKTVVGAAIIAAISAKYSCNDSMSFTRLSSPELQPPDTNTNSINTFPDLSTDLPDHLHKETQKVASGLQAFDLATFLSEAQTSALMCACESRHDTVKDIFRCSACEHTACGRCMGNPKHVYAPRPLARTSPTAFRARWIAQFPTSLRFATVLNINWSHQMSYLGSDLTASYISCARRALESPFFLTAVNRGQQWDFVYESNPATLLLQTGSRPTWMLYAEAPSDEPVKSKLRSILSLPVAHAPIKSRIFHCQWSVAIPDAIKGDLIITAGHSKHRSWRARIGFPDHEDEKVPAEVVIGAHPQSINPLLDEIKGIYEHLPDCGSACELLYKQKVNCEPHFLFLDPSTSGPVELDGMVFARTHDKIKDVSSRRTTIRLEPSFRPWDLGPSREHSSGCIVPYQATGWWSTMDVELERLPMSIELSRPQSFNKKFWQQQVACDSCRHLITLLDAHIRVPLQDQAHALSQMNRERNI